MWIVILIIKIPLYVWYTKEVKEKFEGYYCSKWVLSIRTTLFTWQSISIVSEVCVQMNLLTSNSCLQMSKNIRLPLSFITYLEKSQIVVFPNVYDLNLLRLKLSIQIFYVTALSRFHFAVETNVSTNIYISLILSLPVDGFVKGPFPWPSPH